MQALFFLQCMNTLHDFPSAAVSIVLGNSDNSPPVPGHVSIKSFLCLWMLKELS